MRLFIASHLPPDDARFYGLYARKLAEDAGGVIRPIPRGSIHLTHTFLGEVPDAMPEAIVGIMTSATIGQSPLSVELGPAEVFVAGRAPRVVLAPVTRGAVELYRLEVEIVLALRSMPVLAGLAMPRPPHVTLARFGKAASRSDGQRVSGLLARSPGESRSIRVDHIQLMRSRLTGAGPIYEVVARAEMRGGS